MVRNPEPSQIPGSPQNARPIRNKDTHACFSENRDPEHRPKRKSKGRRGRSCQKTQREAYFQASLALASSQGSSQGFSGKVYGTISHKAAGKQGFGFDPVFIPRGARKTFAQGGTEFKDRYSHRAIAFRKLALWYIKTRV